MLALVWRDIVCDLRMVSQELGVLGNLLIKEKGKLIKGSSFFIPTYWSLAI
jgi:hypothetical protein